MDLIKLDFDVLTYYRLKELQIDERLCITTNSQYIYIYMGVSLNGGTPKSSILIGFSIIFTIHVGASLFFGNPHIVM